MTDTRGKVGIIFSGGPAPGANAVIAAAVSAFRRAGTDVLGFIGGYSALQTAEAMQPGVHYRVFEDRDLPGLRNSRGVCIGTARANPGRAIETRADLADPTKNGSLENVHRNLVALGVRSLISIGGDDTLKTANYLYLYQQQLDAAAQRVRVVHVPKTIDNDYRGIDFTFGFFTAVDVMARELQNLRADAMATRGYFIVESMGRSAGWLAYGVAIAGEAHMVVGVEDVRGALRVDGHLSLDALAERVVDLIVQRESRGKLYGTVVLAEGLTELLPDETTRGLPRDEHGHISLGKIDLGKLVAQRVAEAFKARTGHDKKLTGVQLGYEARSSPPHAFDVMLGSQLGFGAFRALVEEGLDGHMVSVAGQFELHYVPFAELVNPDTLATEVRFIEPGSDFHRLAAQLGTKLEG